MSESSSSDDGEDTWIQWFCALEGHEMFCEVDRSYIEDGFNLYGLRHWVPSINDSLDVILDRVCECCAPLQTSAGNFLGLRAPCAFSRQVGPAAQQLDKNERFSRPERNNT